MNEETVNTKILSVDYFKYIPVFYPILVFLGYLNYDLYYKKFDIDIFNYLSINEFLFSFVSQIYPLIFFFTGFFAWSVYFTFYYHINNSLEEKEREENSARKWTQFKSL